MLGDNYTIEVIKLNEVRILKNKLTENLRSFSIASFQVVNWYLSALHLPDHIEVDLDRDEQDGRIQRVEINTLDNLCALFIQYLGLLSVCETKMINDLVSMV